MIFSVQRFLEEHLERRGLVDVDNYAIQVANAFERAGPRASEATIIHELARIRTVFFRRNSNLDRPDFEARLAPLLRRRFQKKNDFNLDSFRRSLVPARKRIQLHRRSIGVLLEEFRSAVESRGVDSFWDSRKQNQLRRKPEKIAQALFAVFAKAVVGNRGMVLREFASGIGFVDVGISFGGPLHLVELKILTGKLVGANQLATYMGLEQRKVGWLLLIDARNAGGRSPLPAHIMTSAGIVRTVVVDVNPVPPHLA